MNLYYIKGGDSKKQVSALDGTNVKKTAGSGDKGGDGSESSTLRRKKGRKKTENSRRQETDVNLRLGNHRQHRAKEAN